MTEEITFNPSSSVAVSSSSPEQMCFHDFDEISINPSYLKQLQKTGFYKVENNRINSNKKETTIDKSSFNVFDKIMRKRRNEKKREKRKGRDRKKSKKKKAYELTARERLKASFVKAKVVASSSTPPPNTLPNTSNTPTTINVCTMPSESWEEERNHLRCLVITLQNEAKIKDKEINQLRETVTKLLEKTSKNITTNTLIPSLLIT
jgi:hypothetical protein